MTSDIILAGVGGQGILTIASIIGRAALQLNLQLKQAEVHGMSQRGGDVQSNLRLSSSEIRSDLIGLGGADMIISLEPMEALRYLPWLKPEGTIVTNINPMVNVDNYPDIEAVLDELRNSAKTVLIDAEKIAREARSPRSANVALLGAAAPFTEISTDALRQAVIEQFASKGAEIAELNAAVFDAALLNVSTKN